MCKGFWEVGLEDVVQEVIRIRQEESVEDYQDKFEELRVQLERGLCQNWGKPISYQCSLGD